MQFNGFSTKTIPFLQKLEINNKKEWFELHKDEYEKYILTPSRAFVIEMGEHLQALVPTINALPKINGSLFRIYRDTRFAKDKTPLKTHIGYVFWQGKGIRMQSASFYMMYSSSYSIFGVGIKTFDKDLLETYREVIKDKKKAKALNEILTRAQEKGYTLVDPRYKRFPRGFNKDDTYAHLSLYNGITATKTFDPLKNLHSTQVVHDAYNVYEDLFELQQWLYELTLLIPNEAN